VSYAHPEDLNTKKNTKDLRKKNFPGLQKKQKICFAGGEISSSEGLNKKHTKRIDPPM